MQHHQHTIHAAGQPVDLTTPGTITAELITAEDGTPKGVIDIVGSIGGDIAALPVSGNISNLLAGGVKEIEVRITSYGGCLYTALAIYDTLTAARQAGVQVTGRVYGVAASAATIILMACERIELTAKSELMVHEPATCIYGKVSELQTDVNSLQACWQRMCQLYADRTGKSVQEIIDTHRQDTWYTAEQAIAYGWADAIFAPVEQPGKDTPVEAKADAAPAPLTNDTAETPQPAAEPTKRSLWQAAVDVAARFGLCPPRPREAATATPPLPPEKLLADAAAQQQRMAAEMEGLRAMLAAAQQERSAIAAERDAARADRQADIEREVAARVASLGLPAAAELPAPVSPELPGSPTARVDDATVAGWIAAQDHSRVISYACRSAEANKQVSRLLTQK